MPPMILTEPGFDALALALPDRRFTVPHHNRERIISRPYDPTLRDRMTVSTDAAPRKPGFIARLGQRLNKGKSWLGSGMGAVFGKPVDEASLADLEDALLLADVGVEATERLVDAMRKRARRADAGDKTLSELLCECITELLEPLERPLELKGSGTPRVVLVVGVNGTGKTTTIGKLAHRLRAEGLSVLIAAGDTFRAAAVEQLGRWAERSGATLVSQAEGADPAAVVHDALAAAKAKGIDVVLADTAGRLHTAGGLMDELDKIRRVVKRFDAEAPHEVLLVLDATQGQNALTQAIEFERRVGVSGIAITKLDGTAKGGILLAIAERLGLPIRFIAIGEGIEDFETFRARDFARALTGVEAA
jgi:fused signal recognition particle receptor